MSEQHDPIVFDFTSRHGRDRLPHPATLCGGECDGMGWYPVYKEPASYREPNHGLVPSRVGYSSLIAPVVTLTAHEEREWERQHAYCTRPFARLRKLLDLRGWWQAGVSWRIHWATAWEPCDGWHFIKCQECEGTGKRR